MDCEKTVTGAFRATLERPVPRALLLAPRLILAPTLAPDVSGWLRALPAAVGLLLLAGLQRSPRAERRPT